MRQGLQKLGYPLGAADLDQLLLLLDSDGDGRVHLTEFEHMAR
jgi:Ca2+-binding EF-hand superfamily protein